jgi:hypothetical protein
LYVRRFVKQGIKKYLPYGYKKKILYSQISGYLYMKATCSKELDLRTLVRHEELPAEGPSIRRQLGCGEPHMGLLLCTGFIVELVDSLEKDLKHFMETQVRGRP